MRPSRWPPGPSRPCARRAPSCRRHWREPGRIVSVGNFDIGPLGGPLGLGTDRAYRMIRELVPFTWAESTLPADLEPLVELITRGDLTPAA